MNIDILKNVLNSPCNALIYDFDKKIVISFNDYKFNLTSDIYTDERHYCKLEIKKSNINYKYCI